MRTLGLAALLWSSMASTSAAEGGILGPKDGDAVGCGVYRTLHSAVLGEDRLLLVRLPAGYGESSKRFPVLYKLDGEKGVFLQTIAAVEYLVDAAEPGSAIDHIVVGVVNTDRQRDMDPERGADSFSRFIATELVPFVERSYRTDGRRILAAQSFSTLCAARLLVTQPGVFDSYILSSFGLHKEDLARLLEDELKRSVGPRSATKRLVFVAYGKRDALDPDGSTTRRGANFLALLAKTWAPGVRVMAKTYEDEGHVPFPSIHDGLKWMYSERKSREEDTRGEGARGGE